jgi:hypothetical protein
MSPPGQTIFFTTKALFRQPRAVRRLLAIGLVFGCLCSVYAQEQEDKLVSRLLRPNTALGNTDQNKKFTAADGAQVDKHARVGTFYFQRKSLMKTYANTRDFQTEQYDARTFDSSGTGSSLLAAKSTTQTPSYATPTARTSVELRDGHKEAGSRNFAGNRPFLDKGKSQKSLDRKNPPMTIEQVRELLNKSK